MTSLCSYQGRVIALEPVAAVYDALQHNIRMHAAWAATQSMLLTGWSCAFDVLCTLCLYGKRLPENYLSNRYASGGDCSPQRGRRGWQQEQRRLHHLQQFLMWDP